MREGFLRKRCPKCGGNLYLDRDGYGWSEKCLQCSFTQDIETADRTTQNTSSAVPVRAGRPARMRG